MTTSHLIGGEPRVGDLDLNRIGYAAMQLAGPGVFAPPRDHAVMVEGGQR